MKWKILFKLSKESNAIIIYVKADTITQGLAMGISIDYKLARATWLQIERV